MPDDKSKVGEPDRSKVAKDQDYGVSYLIHELGISSEEVRKLIDRFGGNREKIYAAAEMLKQGRQDRFGICVWPRGIFSPSSSLCGGYREGYEPDGKGNSLRYLTSWGRAIQSSGTLHLAIVGLMLQGRDFSHPFRD